MTANLRVERRAALWMIGAATAVGFLLFGYKALDHYTRGYAVPVHVPFIEEMTAAWGALLLLWLIVPRAVDYAGLDRGLVRVAVVNLAGAAAFSVLHTAWNWSTRAAIFALIGERYDYGRMPARFAMEAPMDLVVYASFAAALVAIRQRRIARKQRADAMESDMKLVEAQLRNLRSQLDPHFLFNALNTVSAVMYDDPARADEIIGHLSELLRASLRSGEAREVSLQSELTLVEHYFAIIRARFGDRASLAVNVPVELLGAQLPPLTLQPIVENAVRHGRLSAGAPGSIELSAVRAADALEIRVFDNGDGIPSGIQPPETGIGLGALRERLSLMYGAKSDLKAGNCPGGGFATTVRVPWRTGPSSTA